MIKLTHSGSEISVPDYKAEEMIQKGWVIFEDSGLSEPDEIIEEDSEEE